MLSLSRHQQLRMQAVSPFIDPVTKKKIFFLDSAAGDRKMAELFDLDDIETCMGGRVPGTLYNHEEYGQRMMEVGSQNWITLEIGRCLTTCSFTCASSVALQPIWTYLPMNTTRNMQRSACACRSCRSITGRSTAQRAQRASGGRAPGTPFAAELLSYCCCCSPGGRSVCEVKGSGTLSLLSRCLQEERSVRAEIAAVQARMDGHKLGAALDMPLAVACHDSATDTEAGISDSMHSAEPTSQGATAAWVSQAAAGLADSPQSGTSDCLPADSLLYGETSMSYTVHAHGKYLFLAVLRFVPSHPFLPPAAS